MIKCEVSSKSTEFDHTSRVHGSSTDDLSIHEHYKRCDNAVFICVTDETGKEIHHEEIQLSNLEHEDNFPIQVNTEETEFRNGIQTVENTELKDIPKSAGNIDSLDDFQKPMDLTQNDSSDITNNEPDYENNELQFAVEIHDIPGKNKNITQDIKYLGVTTEFRDSLNTIEAENRKHEQEEIQILKASRVKARDEFKSCSFREIRGNDQINAFFIDATETNTEMSGWKKFMQMVSFSSHMIPAFVEPLIELLKLFTNGITK